MEIQTDPKSQNDKKVRDTVGLLLTIVMLILTAYVLIVQTENYKTLQLTTDLSLNANDHQSKNYRHYVKQYASARTQLEETQGRLGKMTLELELVSKELDATRAMLSEAENLLAMYQQGVRPQGAASDNEQNLVNMKKQNEQASNELSQLRSDLVNYQTDVSGLKEGTSLIDDLKSKIKAVKERMAAIKKEARNAKIAAQQERDRQLAMLGNNGYVLKEGQNTLGASVQKSVNIDVQFVP